MKFQGIEFHSHQRSGSHYVAAVITKNFLGTDDYLPYYKNHFIGDHVHQAVWGNPNVAFVYVWRNQESVLSSMWNFRRRLGLTRCESYEDFRSKPAHQMYERGVCDAQYVGLRDTRATTGVSLYFSNVSVSPEEHWKLHKLFWEMLEARPNVKLVNYDQLVGDFNRTMQGVADWLGSDRTEFENIEQRVGWTAK
jgi:hypothetical protein